ncbi:unnamed protein product [Trichobilharzia regenti]|nr:unnamed protein product [Trichobilharzia regenti]
MKVLPLTGIVRTLTRLSYFLRFVNRFATHRVAANTGSTTGSPGSYIKDHSVHKRHLDKVTISEVRRSNYNFNDSANNTVVDNSEISPDSTDENNITESVSEISPDNTDENNITESVRRSQLPASKTETSL